MAIIYRCDRCNKEDDKPDFVTSIEGEIANSYGSSSLFLKKQICWNCFKELIEWIKPLPKVKEF